MSWTSLGDAVCDSCGEMRTGHCDRHQAIQIIRAGSWHHSIGTTIGGVPYEQILCKECARGEHKRPRKTLLIDQEETLPFDWEQWRNSDTGTGYTSR